MSRTVVTDADGAFTITFANGDGDYWLTIVAIGYASRRMEVRRVADQEILRADARLARSVPLLDSVLSQSSRKRATPDTSSLDISGTERRMSSDLLTLDQFGDLALIAGTIPGVQIIPGENGAPSGISVFGLGAEQSETTLNGLPFSGSALPRDAAFDASVALSPYDVSRGGFSGAQIALRSRPPTNITLRANSVALDAPWLQWTDPVGRSLGQQFGSASVGGVLTTPIRRDRAFAHIAYQAGRRFSDLRSLDDVDDAALRAAGLSSDSVTRLRSTLSGFGIPATVPRVPSPAAVLTKRAGVRRSGLHFAHRRSRERAQRHLHRGVESIGAAVGVGNIVSVARRGAQQLAGHGAEPVHALFLGRHPQRNAARCRVVGDERITLPRHAQRGRCAWHPTSPTERAASRIVSFWRHPRVGRRGARPERW